MIFLKAAPFCHLRFSKNLGMKSNWDSHVFLIIRFFHMITFYYVLLVSVLVL